MTQRSQGLFQGKKQGRSQGTTNKPGIKPFQNSACTRRLPWWCFLPPLFWLLSLLPYHYYLNKGHLAIFHSMSSMYKPLFFTYLVNDQNLQPHDHNNENLACTSPFIIEYKKIDERHYHLDDSNLSNALQKPTIVNFKKFKIIIKNCNFQCKPTKVKLRVSVKGRDDPQ